MKNHIYQLMPKFSSACYAIVKSPYVTIYFKDDLFLLCTFYYDLWYTFVGQFTVQYPYFYDSNKNNQNCY
jgi:hypothetical protein